MSDEEMTQMAPGLIQAFAAQEDKEEQGGRRRRRTAADEAISALRTWTPKTRLGREVMAGRIVTYEQALASGLPIREVEIVDALIPNLEDEVIKVNMVQRMTDSGRRVRFNVLCAVGNGDGYVGLSVCKGKEVASTIRKAIDKAKLNIIPVMRGNGSWESSEGPGTSVPFMVTGRSGSTKITLMPAPAGKGLVIGDYGRRVLNLAGVTDVWSRSSGQTRTTINFAKATFNALIELNKTRLTEADHRRLNIIRGRELS